MMGSIKRNLPCQVVVPPKNVVVLIAIVIYSSMNLVPIFLNLVEGEHFGNETKKIIHSVQNFSSRLILNLSDGDDTVSADEIAFKEKWPHIKSKLCPDNVPSSRKYGAYDQIMNDCDLSINVTKISNTIRSDSQQAGFFSTLRDNNWGCEIFVPLQILTSFGHFGRTIAQLTSTPHLCLQRDRA
mmetsp:Transcript_8426/g.17764  ORF Transcript_8426/g.17764 Transcript_8426/m.17764 type:complete len:184 (-) Transcript_8426:784-1335(-)